MPATPQHHRSRKVLILVCGAIGFILLVVLWSIRSGSTPWNAVSAAVTSATVQSEPFPDIDTTGLSSTRQRVIALARQEHTAQPEPTKYSEGIKEAWCADFLSWIMREAGSPYANPNSGSWRIPGVYTLKDYYESRGTFRSADSGYTPQPGDTALYYDSPIFGGHVNIVLENHDGILTTVGGNEGGKIRVYKNTSKNYTGLIGYGVAN